MKLGYGCAPCGCEEAGKDGVNETGETGNQHSHTKVGRLQQMFQVGLSYRLWMISEQPLDDLHQFLRSDKRSARPGRLAQRSLKEAGSLYRCQNILLK